MRSAGQLAARPHLDLNLPQPVGEAAVGPEDQRGDIPAFEGDLSASRPAIPSFSLHPVLGALSSAQARFLSELREGVLVSVSRSDVPRTVRTYEAAVV